MSEQADAFARALPVLAVETVRHALRGKEIDPATVAGRLSAGDTRLAEALAEPAATFVTLRHDGKLRGCIGALLPQRPLYLDVVHNARRSMVDPRMAPVTSGEWPRLWISVALLSAPRQVEADGLAALRELLRPGVDGLTLRQGTRRATFLPSVWETMDDPDKFVRALLRKGGWDDNAWPEGMRAETYQASDFTSPPPRRALHLEDGADS